MGAVPGDANWTDIAGSNATTYDPALLTTTTKYVRKAVDVPAVHRLLKRTDDNRTSADAAGVVTGTTTICYNTDVPIFGSTTPASGGDGVISYAWQYTTNMGCCTR